MPTNCVSVVDSQLFLSDPDQGDQLIMDPARFGSGSYLDIFEAIELKNAVVK
jgi:hypothetical protein